jgi:hypothetical protein
LRVGLAVVGTVDKFLGGLEVTVGFERPRGGAGSLFGALLLRLGRLVVIRLDKDGGKTGLVR